MSALKALILFDTCHLRRYTKRSTEREESMHDTLEAQRVKDREIFIAAECEYFACTIKNLEERIHETKELLDQLRLRFEAFADGTNEEHIKEKGILRTKIIQTSGLLKKLELSRECFKEDIGTVYERMLAVPGAKRIFIEEGTLGRNLVIETDPLFGKYRTLWGLYSSWHRLGPYKISVEYPNLIGGDARDGIKIINLEGTRKCVTRDPFDRTYHEYHGPTYIHQTGKVICFGDARDQVTDALLDRDWPTIVAILIRFPECMGRSKFTRFWPKVRRRNVPQWYKQTFGWW